ncbi:MAG TPA: CYTH domain-containing protein [Deltaproteobacteria bacterium]|nr:CYTH domain-containing protein [Deltaproteobacteria bacterium]
MGIEIETTLRIDSSRPDDVMKNLATLDVIGEYTIVSKSSCIIHDRYFDTRDRSFMKRGFALRLRQRGPSFLLCLKGCERINEWGGIERLEIEEAWSEKTLEAIIRALDETSINIECPLFDKDDPVQTLSGHGLRIIQDRQTHRIERDVGIHQGTALRSCALMALDTVCYRFADRCLKHFEVEIEAKSRTDEHHIEIITELLKKGFPRKLKRWDHNKLITGYAIETLLDRGDVLSGIHEKEIIDHVGYTKIDAFINQLRL